MYHHGFLWFRVLYSEPAVGLSDFHQVSLTGSTGVSGCKSRRQFLGCLALLLYENRQRYLGNRGNGFFKKNILSFSLIHCSWRFGALLLNCSFYGYRHLHQQPFRRLSPRITIANPPPHPPVLGVSVLLLHPQYQACKCALLSSLWGSSRVAIFLCSSYRIKHFPHSVTHITASAEYKKQRSPNLYLFLFRNG